MPTNPIISQTPFLWGYHFVTLLKRSYTGNCIFFLIQWSFSFLLFTSLALFFYLVFNNIIHCVCYFQYAHGYWYTGMRIEKFTVTPGNVSTSIMVCGWDLKRWQMQPLLYSPCLGVGLTQNILTYLASVLIHGLQTAFSFYVWSKTNIELVWLFFFS